MNIKKLGFVSVLALTGAMSSVAHAEYEHLPEKTTIDLLVYYTDAVKENNTRYEIDRVIREKILNSENIFKDNGFNLRLNIKYIKRTSAFKDTKDFTMIETKSELNNATEIIEQTKNSNADLFVLFRQYTKGGVGVVMFTPKKGAKFDKINAISISFTGDRKRDVTHEFGHTLGLNHSRSFFEDVEKHSKKSFNSNGYGYGKDGDFVTIMSYEKKFIIGEVTKKNLKDNPENFPEKILKFSSPNFLCNGSPCGISGKSDSISVLKETIPLLSSISTRSKGQEKENTLLKQMKKKSDDFKKFYNEANTIYKNKNKIYYTLRKDRTVYIDFYRSYRKLYTEKKKEIAIFTKVYYQYKKGEVNILTYNAAYKRIKDFSVKYNKSKSDYRKYKNIYTKKIREFYNKEVKPFKERKNILWNSYRKAYTEYRNQKRKVNKI